MRARQTPWGRWVGDRPIVTRLVVAVAAAMAVVLVLSAAFVYWRVEYALNRQLNQDLAAYRSVVERAVHDGTRPPAETPGESFQVFGQDHSLRAASAAGLELVDPHVVDAALTGAPQRRDVGSFLPVPEHAYRVVATRVSSPTGPVVVVTAISRRKQDEALRELLLQLSIADALALVAAAAVGYRTARAALGPVERYRQSVEGVGNDLERRLPVDTGREDELTRLGHTFNALLARIEAASVRERHFLADASHELRSPLALLKAELDWALLKPRSEAEMREVLLSLDGQIDRLVGLANALLELEELRADGALPREVVDVHDLIDDVARRFRRTAEAEGRSLVTDTAHVKGRLNARWLDLALGNLVSNALTYGAGTVTVRAARRHGDRLVVSVEDEGAGFPAEFVADAFERFTRADESRTSRGSGLGLSLVEAVAEAHGGTAGIEGSRVTLDLPV